jgi:hypothetical protein
MDKKIFPFNKSHMANKIALWVKKSFHLTKNHRANNKNCPMGKKIFPFNKSHMTNKITLWAKKSFHLTKAIWLIKLPHG